MKQTINLWKICKKDRIGESFKVHYGANGPDLLPRAWYNISLDQSLIRISILFICAESRTYSLKNHGHARGYFPIQTFRKDNESCLDSGANCNGNPPFSSPANVFLQ